MSSCLKNGKIEDCTDNSCGDGYECCYHGQGEQKSKAYCVQVGSCNRKTGICRETTPTTSGITEKFTVFSKEGYDSDCNCKTTEYLLYLVIFVVFALVLFVCLKKKKL